MTIVDTMYLRSFWSLIRVICVAGLLSITIMNASFCAESKFRDPLDSPAETRSSIAARPFLGITHAGNRLVAIGSRGLIAYSDDRGKSWIQSSVPVQSDLLAVHFPNASDGWAVGHDGVVLKSGDGGKSWVKQFDGRIAAEAFKRFYAAQATDPAMEAAASLIDLNFKSGPTLPYLGVWFDNAEKGYVVGSFGMIAATADGGKTWEPWLHRIENDQALHLNSIREVGGNLYIVGERGTLFKLDRLRQRFEAITTGYAGSFFGIIGKGETLLAYGLQGVAYHSNDAGKTWEALTMPSEATITGATEIEARSEIILINSIGEFLVSDMEMRHFDLVKAEHPGRFTGVIADNNGYLVVTGMRGVHTEELNSK